MNHEFFMLEALKQAQLAFLENEIPVGAVIVHNNKIIAACHNMREQLKDPTAHAEILAIKQASQVLNKRRLNDCTLYVTLEPCPMCAGAIIMANVEKCIFGAADKNQGCCQSLYNLPSDPNFYNNTVCVGGLLENECKQILQDFFANKR